MRHDDGGERRPDGLRVAVLIPARDEEESLPGLLETLREGGAGPGRPAGVLVVDNGSRDRTAEVARAAGARVVAEPSPGYGRACQRGLAELADASAPPDVVVFLDADDSLAARQLDRLVKPLARGEAELVTGRRVGPEEGVPGHAKLGNAAAAAVLRGVYGVPVTELGPFRAARFRPLLRLGLDHPDFGWNVQMEVRAAKAGYRVVEVPVLHRPRRRGTSKISHTLPGSVGAARGIVATLLREVISGR